MFGCNTIISMNDMEDLRSELQSLSAGELHDLRDSIEEELECLDQYSDYWNEFNTKYKASVDSLEMLSKINSDENITLMKLGNHVFTPGKLITSNKVLVFLGDGYYAKMSIDDAKKFFKRKTKCLLKDFDEYEEGNNIKQHLFMLVQETLENKIKGKIDNFLGVTQSQEISSPNHNPANPE